MSYSRSLVHRSGFSEELKVVNDLNDSGSHVLRPLNATNRLGV